MTKVPVLLGATGSGKTSLVCGLAEFFPRLEVVVCDSRQIYREMPVTTAAPTAEQRALVRHHMLEILSPAEETSAFAYREQAIGAIAEIQSRGGLPLLVAGTGFYFRALKSAPGKPPAPEEVRARVAAMSHEQRLSELLSTDRARFESLPQKDPYRVQRALEIALSPEAVPRPAAVSPLFGAFYLERDPADLDAALFARVLQMIDAGMVDEMRRVKERYGLCPGLKTIGFDLAEELLAGRMSTAVFSERLFREHRQYAKRQRTWFRKEQTEARGGPDDFAAWLRYFVDQDS